MIIISDESTRKELYEEILNVKFDGQSGTVQYIQDGDRLPVKIEIVNIYVNDNVIVDKQDGQVIDIGDAEFQSINDYRFEIDSIPVWSGGSTAIPSDRADEKEEHLASFMTLTVFWMLVAVVVGHLLAKYQVYRIPESGAVLIFGIISGLSLRFLHADLSEVPFRRNT